MKRTFLIVIFIAVGALVTSLIVNALGPDPNAVPGATEVNERTMSPFCPGLTLSECTSPQSAELRDRIAKKVESGWTNREIDDWLLQSYGESILGRPRGPLPYVVPAAVLVAGAVAVTVFILRGLRNREHSEMALDPEINDEDRSRLELEIRTFAEGTE